MLHTTRKKAHALLLEPCRQCGVCCGPSPVCVPPALNHAMKTSLLCYAAVSLGVLLSDRGCVLSRRALPPPLFSISLL